MIVLDANNGNVVSKSDIINRVDGVLIMISKKVKGIRSVSSYLILILSRTYSKTHQICIIKFFII